MPCNKGHGGDSGWSRRRPPAGPGPAIAEAGTGIMIACSLDRSAWASVNPRGNYFASGPADWLGNDWQLREKKHKLQVCERGVKFRGVAQRLVLVEYREHEGRSHSLLYRRCRIPTRSVRNRELSIVHVRSVAAEQAHVRVPACMLARVRVCVHTRVHSGVFNRRAVHAN